jgi:hypothetical protein
MRLLDYSRNVYSQNGEDGILTKILEIIGTTDKWCVEFGAWDGQYLSNTCNFIENLGYSAVLIEASKERFEDLIKRHGKNPKVVALNKLVGHTHEDGLDTILAKTCIPKDFDLLSIDIDGNDYHVWNAMSSYTPKVLCIEFNSSIPTEVDFIQSDHSRNHGSSLLSLTRLGKKKGYELVAVTYLNAIFVRSEFYPLFQITNNEPRAIREDTSTVTYVFCGYDGTIFLAGNERLLWHEVPFSGRIRQLPKIFRSYPGSFGKGKRLLFKAYKKLLSVINKV